MEITQTELEEMILQELQSQPYGPKGGQISAPDEDSGNPLVGILKSLTRGVTDPMKEDLARRILVHLEIDPGTPVAKVFINFIGNLAFEDIAAIIMEGERCPTIARELGDALAETVIEAIPETLGIEPQGYMAKIIRESLSTSLAEELGERITEALCSIDFSDLLKDLPGGKFLKRLLFRN